MKCEYIFYVDSKVFGKINVFKSEEEFSLVRVNDTDLEMEKYSSINDIKEMYSDLFECLQDQTFTRDMLNVIISEKDICIKYRFPTDMEIYISKDFDENLYYLLREEARESSIANVTDNLKGKYIVDVHKESLVNEPIFVTEWIFTKGKIVKKNDEYFDENDNKLQIDENFLSKIVENAREVHEINYTLFEHENFVIKSINGIEMLEIDKEEDIPDGLKVKRDVTGNLFYSFRMISKHGIPLLTSEARLVYKKISNFDEVIEYFKVNGETVIDNSDGTGEAGHLEYAAYYRTSSGECMVAGTHRFVSEKLKEYAAEKGLCPDIGFIAL